MGVVGLVIPKPCLYVYLMKCILKILTHAIVQFCGMIFFILALLMNLMRQNLDIIMN